VLWDGEKVDERARMLVHGTSVHNCLHWPIESILCCFLISSTAKLRLITLALAEDHWNSGSCRSRQEASVEVMKQIPFPGWAVCAGPPHPMTVSGIILHDFAIVRNNAGTRTQAPSSDGDRLAR
jgi:hypothetical protein